MTTSAWRRCKVRSLRPRAAERDRRQAMPRAEPALSRAPLLLPAVAGAAITTGITTPVKGVLGTTTLRLTTGIRRLAEAQRRGKSPACHCWAVIL
jgi:hypothetical protein